MIPPLFKKSWRGMSGVLDPIPQTHDAFSLAPGSLGTLNGQQYSLLVGDLTPALNLVYAALGHTHAMADIIGLGTAAAANVGDFAAAIHNHVLADITDAGTAAAANAGDFAAAAHTHVLADITDAGTAAAANVGDFAAASHAHAASDITSGTLDTARLGSGTANATTYLRGDQTWQSIVAGIGGSTGATDNLALRADGVGGSTVQNSALRIDDVTASTQQNLTLANADAAANSSLVITPKGTGAFILGDKPNGATSGGNARGVYAVDLQIHNAGMLRGSADRVAGSYRSFCAGTNNKIGTNAALAIVLGNFNTIDGGSHAFLGHIVMGYANTTTGVGAGAVLLGRGNSSHQVFEACALGSNNAVNAHNSIVIGNRGTVSSAHTGTIVMCASYTLSASSDRADQLKIRADAGITHQNSVGTMTFWGKLAAAPVSGINAGDIYYDTVTNKHYGYNGATWNAFW